jgi:amino-acid N-acetyltransferase
VTDSINWFRETSPYINAHRRKTLVMCLPDQMLGDDILPTLSHDITLLSHLGLHLVLCFGLRGQIDAQLGSAEHTTRFHDGRRVTDDVALEAILAAAGLTRSKLEARLSMGLPNTPMAGARLTVCSGNFVTGQPFGIHEGIDFQHTGSVREVQTAAIDALLAAGHLVLLPPLGYSLTGEVFNLPAEEVAMQAAIALNADKLVYFMPQLPVDIDGSVVRQASANHMQQLSSRQHDDDLSRTINRAVSCCRQGVERVHLLDSSDPSALLSELFTRDGSGTLITEEHWEVIRQATIGDVGGIIELITPLQENGTLATRSREQLELDIENFVVCERDNMVVACAALHVDEPAQKTDARVAEIACVVTHHAYRGDGRADRLLAHLENMAREQHCRRALLLSTRTGHWFVERGYVESSADALTASRQSSYNRQRNSKVFIKELL